MNIVDQYREQLQENRPITYKDLELHPLTVRHFALYQSAKPAFELMQGTLPPALARRRARVAISTPPFLITAFVISSENFPEPKIKRELNSCPPIINGSFMFLFLLRQIIFLYFQEAVPGPDWPGKLHIFELLVP